MKLEKGGVYIVSGARTPHGSYRGALSGLSATALGAHAVKAALARAPSIKPEAVDELIIGNVLSANLGQNPAKQCAVASGLPSSVPCSTVNKVCASGLKAVTNGAQSIMTGHATTVVAAGTEAMSNCPLYVSSAIRGSKALPVSGLLRDGLTDAYGSKEVMGLKAEHCAGEHGISREEQDNCALESYRKVRKAHEEGWLDNEIAPILCEDGIRVIEKDEPLSRFNPQSLSWLKPAFDAAKGTVTAATAASISDGASAVVLMSGSKAEELGVKPLARVVEWADAELEPDDFITAPAVAVNKVMQRSGFLLDQVDVFEINEAFSVSVLANISLLGLDIDKVNLHGGSLAIGHPLGSSGCRILVSLLTVMLRTGARLGCACVCNGGGGATAVLLERVDEFPA
ncbi:thiolase [Aureobasidium pullulans]|nr:thiolase [Aureobasidium pullulans]